MFRTVSDAAEIRAARPLEPRVSIEHVLEVPPIMMATVPGFETAVFPTPGHPFLNAWDSRCSGPGSIHAAHTLTSSSAPSFRSGRRLRDIAEARPRRSLMSDPRADDRRLAAWDLVIRRFDRRHIFSNLGWRPCALAALLLG
jgi:hypothetical protein